MIPFDFEYYRPETISEAVTIYLELDKEGKAPVYYGGGTELISMARVGNLSYGAVIDIKNIPECTVMDFDKDDLHLGSALSLSAIAEANYFPLLSKTVGRIADHTMQDKITFGGNLASTILYREAVLPLLLTDAKLMVAGKSGLLEFEIGQVFKESLLLQRGDFVVQAAVKKEFIKAPYFHVKKTKNEKIDYPLLTAEGLKTAGMIRLAFSGLAAYPFRDTAIETILNDTNHNFAQRADQIVQSVSNRVLNDLCGSAEYRNYVLKNTIVNLLETMKGQS